MNDVCRMNEEEVGSVDYKDDRKWLTFELMRWSNQGNIHMENSSTKQHFLGISYGIQGKGGWFNYMEVAWLSCKFGAKEWSLADKLAISLQYYLYLAESRRNLIPQDSVNDFIYKYLHKHWSSGSSNT